MGDEKRKPNLFESGRFLLHTMKACTDSVLTFPNGTYQGLGIYIDLQEASDTPPELLKNFGIFETILPENSAKMTILPFLPEMNRQKVFFCIL